MCRQCHELRAWEFAAGSRLPAWATLDGMYLEFVAHGDCLATQKQGRRERETGADKERNRTRNVSRTVNIDVCGLAAARATRKEQRQRQRQEWPCRDCLRVGSGGLLFPLMMKASPETSRRSVHRSAFRHAMRLGCFTSHRACVCTVCNVHPGAATRPGPDPVICATTNAIPSSLG